VPEARRTHPERGLVALAAMAALAACAGTMSSAPVAPPGGSSSTLETVVLNGTAGTQQSVALPSAGGYSGTMMVTFGGSASGVSAGVSLGTSPPPGAPAPTGTDQPLVFVGIVTGTNVALTTVPAFTFAVPDAALESIRRLPQSGTVTLHLKLFDPVTESAGYQTVETCTPIGTTVTCTGGTTAFNLAAQEQYVFALTESAIVAAPTATPSAAAGGAAVISIPTAAPIACNPTADIVGVDQTNIVACTEPGYAGPFTIAVADPTIASVQLANDLTYTYFSITGLRAGTTTLTLTSQPGITASLTITVAL